MPARPALTHPGDEAIEAAMSRTLTALSAVLQTLGDGEHTLNLVAERTDHAFVTGRTDLSIGIQPLRLAVLDDNAFCTFRMLLVFALEASTMRSTVLIATTAAEPRPRACGWAVQDGWLHPLDTDGLQAAVVPCPDPVAVEREVHPAPVLPQLPDTDEENPHD
ncbi:hypothetical protein [Streptomyces sp. NPDC057280]|uniref:hypothetical protein n=1 Tax=Streptomyces sp. NPDC057280 TaxID=3346081 RepID=UPI003631102E